MQKKWIQMKKDRRGDIGVGTMIIFIALVLVAAVAASVLITTANSVREQATQTGNDAITDVSSGFDVEYVTGEATGNAITQLEIYLSLSAGSPSIDMNNVIASLTYGSQSGDMVYANVTSPGVGELTFYLNRTNDPDLSRLFEDDVGVVVQDLVDYGPDGYPTNMTHGANVTYQVNGIEFFSEITYVGLTNECTVVTYEGSAPDPLKEVPQLSFTTSDNYSNASSVMPSTYSGTVVDFPMPEDFAMYQTVSQGELVELTIGYVNGELLHICPGDSVTIKVLLSAGSATLIQFTAPGVLTAGTMDLR